MATKTATLEFLGTGTSTGVPVAGCTCVVCRSCDAYDKRLRSSVSILNGSRRLIIDTGPEFRVQCIRADILRIDAILITHDHADHLHGLDDIRAFSLFKKKRIPVWASAETIATIRHRFDYIWHAKQVGGGLPDISLNEVKPPSSFTAAGVRVIPVPIKHGSLDIMGYRLGDLAYLTDLSELPAASLPLLENLETMVVSCARHRPHATHLNLAGVKKLHNLVRPARTLLTHLTHWLPHKRLIMELPLDISPAYDGMRVEICL